MLLVSYNPSTQEYTAMRNNGNGFAESRKFIGGVVKQEWFGHGDVESILNMAQQVPNQFHVVPNPKPSPRKVWGRMVL